MSEITVVVPSYNHAPFVERTLRSIYAQSYRPKKLIVIDDGSNDESPSVIRQTLKECPFSSEFIARENRGLCATLNEGFANSNTEYFAYIGSDDMWKSSMLGEQISLLESRPQALLAFSHAYLIDDDDNIIDSTANWTEFTDGDMLPYLLRGQIFSSPGVVYRSAAMRKHRWNERSILEDYELYLRLAVEGKFARNTEILCGWRQHGSNVSSNMPRMVSEWIAAQNRVAEILPIGRDELEHIQTELRFQSVASLVRSGYRREALRMFVENIGGARSISQIALLLARLAVPKFLFDANVKRKRKKSIATNGKMKI